MVTPPPPHHCMMAVGAIAFLTLSVASCNIGAHNQEPVVTSLAAQSVDYLKRGVSPQDLNDASLEILSAKGSTLFISTSRSTGTATEKSDTDATRIVSRDPSTDQFQGAVSIKPSSANHQMLNSIEDLEDGYDSTLSQSHSGDIVVSPDGRYISLVLKPDELQRAESRTDQRTYVVVLDTQTGKTVRTAEVSGIVLGQALTNSALAVETAQSYFPAGSGKGVVSVFSIKDSDARPSSFSTNQWLIGASGKSLLLAPDVPPIECTRKCTPYTVTRSDIDGHAVDTMPGVTAVHPGGWVSQYKDPKAATDLLQQINASRGANNALVESALNLPKQLVHIDTGRTMDTTSMTVDERQVPNGPGLVVYQDVPTGSGSTESKPEYWLSAADDGHPHTEDLEQFQEDS